MKAVDLKGKEVTVTVVKLFQEKIEGKWVLIAKLKEGTEKDELKLNRTNGEAMAAMFGKKSPDKAWVGKRITLGSEMVWAFGEKTPAIRIVGSPDITGPVKVDVDLGRVQIARTLRRTGNGNGGTEKGIA